MMADPRLFPHLIPAPSVAPATQQKLGKYLLSENVKTDLRLVLLTQR